jgi:hypothetical protein
VIDRNKELQLIENYPSERIVKAPPAFCTVSLQSELSEREREFHHSEVKKKRFFMWPKSRSNRGATFGYRK